MSAIEFAIVFQGVTQHTHTHTRDSLSFPEFLCHANLVPWIRRQLVQCVCLTLMNFLFLMQIHFWQVLLH